MEQRERERESRAGNKRGEDGARDGAAASLTSDPEGARHHSTPLSAATSDPTFTPLSLSLSQRALSIATATSRVSCT